MIGTWVFILAFILVALAVVGVAMTSGGGRRAPKGEAEGRGQRRAWMTGLMLVIVIVGVGVPLAVIIGNNDTKAKNGPGGIELTEAQADARQTFAIKCGNCHTLGASNSVGRVGPNLDQLRPPAALVLNAIQQGRARGMGQMPANVISGQEAKDVAAYVEKVAGR
ncbi:MAG: cytochrome c [Solirubrobacterales bacterium]|nr:cytochrome c [Solirubrobacterales bacterium]